MERTLQTQTVEGEVGLVIDYQPGQALAVNVLQGAMNMIVALDKLDSVLLSCIDTALEPVSVLNDVQHSSLKMLLARALRNAPDDLLASLDWKQWVGALLVKGKYRLLQKIDADGPEIQKCLESLEPDYRSTPEQLTGYTPPTVADVRDALDAVARARAAVPAQTVWVQTELGDVCIPQTETAPPAQAAAPGEVVVNRGVEFFRVKQPDMLGAAQWTVLRNNRSTRVDMLHQGWVDAYHRREHSLLPGDSLKCNYEERVVYDTAGYELSRSLAIVQVLAIVRPPIQPPLL